MVPMYYVEPLTFFSHFKNTGSLSRLCFCLYGPLVESVFSKMDRKSPHESFNSLNCEWKGEPQPARADRKSVV